MSKEAMGQSGALLGSSSYWERVNRATFLGNLMQQSGYGYWETLRAVAGRANHAVGEIHQDLQEKADSLSRLDHSRRNSLEKLVRGLYDVCRMRGGIASQADNCISLLQGVGLFQSSPSFNRPVAEKAVKKMKNDSRFFASECVELVEKASDWGIGFAAGSDRHKREFLEEVSQGKGKAFFQEVLEAYKHTAKSADLRGRCGYEIGSSDYLTHFERSVFGQDLPSGSSVRWGSPSYTALLRDALERIFREVERDLEVNARENNYITDTTAEVLRAAAKELERCGVGGMLESKIEKLAWFVGGDPSKIRQLQGKLNATGLVPLLSEDGVYGKKTQESTELFVDRIRRNLEEVLLNKEAMKYMAFCISLQINFALDKKRLTPGVEPSEVALDLTKVLFSNRKAIQRFIWKQGAELYLRKNGYTVAAFLLEHALESPSSDLHVSQSSWVTQKVMQSTGFQQAYQELEKNIRANPALCTVSGKMEMDFQRTGDRDLYLGIGKCAIQYTCTQSDTTAIVKFSIDDSYDFDEIRSFKGSVEQFIQFDLGIGALANDAGLFSQADGVISKYRIFITFEQTISLKQEAQR